MVASSGTVGTVGPVDQRNGPTARKPSHLSIDSSGANSTFITALNSQLQVAADSQDTMPEDDFALTMGIDRAALIASDFDADEFLSARRHLPLEELKSQLLSHLKELKTELIELINSDYADFINLSTNLNGVDRMMEDLRKPLNRMKDDANAVKSNLLSVVDNLEQKLEHRAEIREKKASLQLLLNINESVSKVEGLLQISGSDNNDRRETGESISVAKRLERVAIEYNQMQYLVSKGASLPFVANIDWRLVRIKETMSDNLATVLRSCIHHSSSETDSQSNKESLTQCLRTYALIDQTAEAEKLITDELLAPFVNKTIVRSALDHTPTNGQGQGQRRPLIVLLDHVQAFIQTNCTSLISVTQQELKGTNFDIPVNCIWDVTTQAIMKNIPSIFLIGNADVFHRNYMDTMQFVSNIEQLCGSRRSLSRLRSQPAYQLFMKRWQLPAYYKLRFMEISSTIEDVFQMNIDTMQRVPNAEVHLPASNAILQAIERCWSADVFIYGIAFSFWKLTLQLMMRYSIWISANLAKDLDQPKDRTVQSRSSSPAPGATRSVGRSTPTPGPLRAAGPIGKNSVEEMMLQQLSMIVNDIDHVVARLQFIFEKDICPKLPPLFSGQNVLVDSFEQNVQTIRQDVPLVQKKITALITKRCVDTLSNVKNITSRYGEGPPKESSHFVVLILEPLSQYISGSGSVLKSESRQAWTLEVIVATTTRYSALLADRLQESKTLEDKANKMKAAGAKARGGGGLIRTPNLVNAFTNSGSAEVTMSDGDKIRLQCVLDVQAYKTELVKFSIDPDSFAPFQELHANTQPYENLLGVLDQS